MPGSCRTTGRTNGSTVPRYARDEIAGKVFLADRLALGERVDGATIRIPSPRAAGGPRVNPGGLTGSASERSGPPVAHAAQPRPVR
jgi:hypothetical protein